MPIPSNNTPTKVVVKVEKSLETTILGVHEYVLYINGQEYKKLPLDANVREPEPNKSRPYKEMMGTLSDHPEYFFENNLGISVVATKVKPEAGNKFEIEFNEGTGILNGGHTQLAILNSQGNPDISRAVVRVTVRVKNYTTSRIAEIAAAQNSSTAVKEYSLAEKRGLFANIKKYMDPNVEKHIIWYEGREVNKGLEPNDLIAFLNAFNIMSYSSDYSQSHSQPKESANSKATVFKKWENSDNEKDYRIIYPLVNDILKLYEMVQLKMTDYGSGMSSLSVIRDTQGRGKELIFSMEKCPYDIPKQMIFPVFAAFRANVYYDAANCKIGWFEDNEKLFKECNKELCNKLRQSFKASGNELNRLTKDPAIRENLYTTLKDHIDKTGVYKEYDI